MSGGGGGGVCGVAVCGVAVRGVAVHHLVLAADAAQRGYYQQCGEDFGCRFHDDKLFVG